MDKKFKVATTLITVAMAGLTAYSIFIHNSSCNKFGCIFCSIGHNSGKVGFILALATIATVNIYRNG